MVPRIESTMDYWKLSIYKLTHAVVQFKPIMFKGQL